MYICISIYHYIQLKPKLSAIYNIGFCALGLCMRYEFNICSFCPLLCIENVPPPRDLAFTALNMQNIVRFAVPSRNEPTQRFSHLISLHKINCNFNTSQWLKFWNSIEINTHKNKCRKEPSESNLQFSSWAKTSVFCVFEWCMHIYILCAEQALAPNKIKWEKRQLTKAFAQRTLNTHSHCIAHCIVWQVFCCCLYLDCFCAKLYSGKAPAPCHWFWRSVWRTSVERHPLFPS